MRWPCGLKAFGRIEVTRESEGKIQSETRWFALSWLPTPEVLLATVRAHWAIENALHWQLGVSFGKDPRATARITGQTTSPSFDAARVWTWPGETDQ